MADEPTASVELYADSVQVEMGVYGAVLRFGLINGPGKDPSPVASVRVSPQMLHILARILIKTSNSYDTDMGAISLPDTLYAELGLKKDL